MGELRDTDPVMLVVAAFSRCPAVIDWARENLHNRYGPIRLASSVFDFTETPYYDDEMGSGLRKQFFAFERLIDATDLVEIKLATNAMEARAAASDDVVARARNDELRGVVRPINLDPGYLNAGKWVLATTKDQAHRLYLGRGIFAEPTLRFEYGEYVPWPWTYPNYQRHDYREFFKQARSEYLRLLRTAAGSDR